MDEVAWSPAVRLIDHYASPGPVEVAGHVLGGPGTPVVVLSSELVDAIGRRKSYLLVFDSEAHLKSFLRGRRPGDEMVVSHRPGMSSLADPSGRERVIPLRYHEVQLLPSSRRAAEIRRNGLNAGYRLECVVYEAHREDGKRDLRTECEIEVECHDYDYETRTWSPATFSLFGNTRPGGEITLEIGEEQGLLIRTGLMDGPASDWRAFVHQASDLCPEIRALLLWRPSPALLASLLALPEPEEDREGHPLVKVRCQNDIYTGFQGRLAVSLHHPEGHHLMAEFPPGAKCRLHTCLPRQLGRLIGWFEPETGTTAGKPATFADLRPIVRDCLLSTAREAGRLLTAAGLMEPGRGSPARVDK